MKAKLIILPVLLILLLHTTAAAGAGLDITPGNINIGLIYSGSELKFSGTAPGGADIYVKITSPEDLVMELNRKGKVGLFWLNTERSKVSGVPKLYHVLSSAPMDRIPGHLKKELGLSEGFEDIYTRARVSVHRKEGWEPAAAGEFHDYIEAFIGISRKNGLYAVGENLSVNGSEFRGRVKLPPGIPQERSSVTVYAIKDGILLDTMQGYFDVSGTAPVRWLNRMAVYDGPIYGLMAVVLALVFGVAITALFNCLESLWGGGKRNQ